MHCVNQFMMQNKRGEVEHAQNDVQVQRQAFESGQMDVPHSPIPVLRCGMLINSGSGMGGSSSLAGGGLQLLPKEDRLAPSPAPPRLLTEPEKVRGTFQDAAATTTICMGFSIGSQQDKIWRPIKLKFCSQLALIRS